MVESAIQNPFKVLQGASSKSSTQKSKKEPKEILVHRTDQSGRYRIGEPQRPKSISHDNGHLERVTGDGKIVPVPIREPTGEERAKRAVWGAAPGLINSQCRWMKEAAAAYRHFLEGEGADRTFSYANYIREDSQGWEGIVLINKDFIKQIEFIAENREKFNVTSDKYDMGASPDDKYPDDPMYGYFGPRTENWLKVIGAHVVWISAEVEINFDRAVKKDRYLARVTLHAEDRYNFNRGGNAKDVHSNIPDSANGVFEVTGLAEQYDHFATLSYDLTWVEGDPSSISTSLQPPPDFLFDKKCWVTGRAGEYFSDPKKAVLDAISGS